MKMPPLLRSVEWLLIHAKVFYDLANFSKIKYIVLSVHKFYTNNKTPLDWIF